MPRDARHAPFSGKMTVFKLQRLKKVQCCINVANSSTLEMRASWSFLALGGGHDDPGTCLKLSGKTSQVGVIDFSANCCCCFLL